MTGEDAFLNELAELRRRFSIHRFFTPHAAAPRNGAPLGKKYYTLRPSDEWWTTRYLEECYRGSPKKGCVKYRECASRLECEFKCLSQADGDPAVRCPQIACVSREKIKEDRPDPHKELDDLCPFKFELPKKGESSRRTINPHRLLQCYVNREKHLNFLQNELQYVGGYFSFFDWSGHRRKGAHFQKELGEVADLPWSYYLYSQKRWVVPKSGWDLQRILEEWRKVIQEKKSPGKSKYELYREPLDLKHNVHCVTDGEISFFIFAWRFWALRGTRPVSTDCRISPKKPELVRLQLRTINEHKIRLPQSADVLDGVPGGFELAEGIPLFKELEIEGLAKSDGEKDPKHVAVSGRFWGLVGYVVTSEYVRNNLKWRKNVHAGRLETFWSRRPRNLTGDYVVKIRVTEFRRLLESLLWVLANLSPHKQGGKYSLAAFEAESRFPLLIYLIWRMQSPMPFCHIWFPTTNLSLNRIGGGHLAQKYEGEGGDCVSVFAQLKFHPKSGRPSLLTRDKDLVRFIKRHQLYMQAFTTPVVDRIMFGKHVLPHLEEALEETEVTAKRSAAAAILVESYAHNIGAHALPGLKHFINEQWEGMQHGEAGRATRTTGLKGFALSLDGILRTHRQFPEILQYLQGKSAFWNAISRAGNLHGGQFCSLWELIDDFGKNNPLCGTIGDAEGYSGIEFTISFSGHERGKKVVLGKSRVEADRRFRFPMEEAKTIDLLRMELEKRPKVFLPEGIVGRHAVWTIWENILRNVKHCRKVGVDIPFHINIVDDEKCDWYILECWVDLAPRRRIRRNPLESWLGILDRQGHPNMGGVSQSILSAGMVFGLDFVTTERLQRSPGLKVLRLDKGKMIWSFNLWKGDNVRDWSKPSRSEKKMRRWPEPPGRFRITRVTPGDMEAFRKQSEIVRHVVSDSKDPFSTLYDKWISQFLERQGERVGFQTGKYARNRYVRSPDKLAKLFCLFHDAHQSACECDRPPVHSIIRVPYKSTGFMRDFAQPSQEKDLELLEALAININIIDNRLKKAADAVCRDCQTRDCERVVKGGGKGNARLRDFGMFSHSERFRVEKLKPAHCLVIHLSYIESRTSQRNEDSIRLFWRKAKPVCKFIFVTTGRARMQLQNIPEAEIRENLRFIPIENLEACFSQAAELNSPCRALGAKFAMAKALLGS